MLFTDKTGTLTKGKLEVIRFVTPTLTEYINEIDISKNTKLYDLVIKSFSLNNESTYDEYGKVIGGNITDRSLLNFIHKKNIKNKVVKEYHLTVKINIQKLH